MRKVILVAAAAAAVTIGFAAPSQAYTPPVFLKKKKKKKKAAQPAGTARLGYVVDGDTIRLANGQYVRLIGIDTPEQGRPYYGAAKAQPRPADRRPGSAGEPGLRGRR